MIVRLWIATACTLATALLLILSLGLLLRYGLEPSSAFALMLAASAAGVTWSRWAAVLASVEEELADPDDDWQDHCADPACEICAPGPANVQL